MAERRFDCFVIFAEMRTGSNYLEANLAAFPSITCYGEAFNPVFVGGPDREDLFGVTLKARTHDPMPLLDRILSQTRGLPGFRFFHDHDPRILARILPDPRCAKVILTRNPVESYVSRKIAMATGQWRLTDMKHRVDATVQFDGAEFEAHLQARHDFQIALMHGLQITGQTAFYLDYEDLRDLEVINGIARFLGLEDRLAALSGDLKKQNPEELSAKVRNPRAMELTLARMDRFNLARSPGFEPRRGPAVPRYRAASRLPLLFVPLPGGPQDRVLDWMAALDGGGRDALAGGFTQKTLRQWKRRRPGHRTFTVLRHPVARAHHVFCRFIAAGEYPDLRETLRRAYGLPLPPAGRDIADIDMHRAAFLEFLAFVKGNLAGQTSVRVDPAWATQQALLLGVARFAQPDHLLREESLSDDLARLAESLGATAPPLPAHVPDEPFGLDAVCDDAVEAAAKDAYGRDYVAFGFDPWRVISRPPLHAV